MKRIAFLAFVLFTVLIFSSCSKDEGGSSKATKDIVGLWIETEDYYDDELHISKGDDFGWFVEFKSDNTVIEREAIHGCSFSNGYVSGVKYDELEYDSLTLRYEIINGDLFVAGEKYGKVVFLNKDKMRLEWAEDSWTDPGEYTIFERVKGFK